MLFRCSPATRLSWTARLALIAIALLALPASPLPLSSQDAGDALPIDEPIAPARGAAGSSDGQETPAAGLPGAGSAGPAIAPATPVRPATVAVPSADAAPVTAAAHGARGIATGGQARGDGDAIDVDHRLRRMEERIDALLRELQVIRSQMGPPVATARRAGAANGAPARTGTASRNSSYGEAGIRATTPAAGAGLAPRSSAAPGASPAPAPAGVTLVAPGGMAVVANAGEPSADWLPPPRGDLTEEQRARIAELDRNYRDRLEKHKARYAREREEAVRLILEGKDPNTVDPPLQGR